MQIHWRNNYFIFSVGQININLLSQFMLPARAFAYVTNFL